MLFLMPMTISCMQKPAPMERSVNPIPKSPALTNVNKAPAPLTRSVTPPHLLKMATCGINIWCNEQCDHELWARMVDLYRKLEDEPFNQKALIQTILEEIQLSSDKKGNGVWGGLSFTYIKDSQKLDRKKEPANNE